MLTILYNVIIMPLILFIELAFSISYRFTSSAGLSIIVVSIAVNLLCSPLYGMANLHQKAEQEKQARMSHWVDHIKKHFKGDEQYMMLSTYYRQQNYRPVMALVGSIPLLLQVPFFIAAYNYLSNLTILRSASFGPLVDLGSPDCLIKIGSLTLNLLPVLMTLLNVISTFVYTKGSSFRDKVQAYGLALLFLILLYNSPSGLVLYWTFNQVFSLIRNMKDVIPRPSKKTVVLCAQVAIVALILVSVHLGLLTSSRRVALLVILVLAVEVSVLIHLKGACFVKSNSEEEDSLKLFLASAASISVLLGATIPSSVLAASPAEFININSFQNPLVYVLFSFEVSFGFFAIWSGVYYFLFERAARSLMAKALFCTATIFIVDYFFFGRDLGRISTSLIYYNEPSFGLRVVLINALLIILVGIAAFMLATRKRLLAEGVAIVLALSTLGLSIPNIISINSVASSYEAQSSQVDSTEQQVDGEGASAPDLFDEDGNIIPLISLSREHENVVVLFIDRGIGSYVPYIFNERPELEEQFDGFVFYENTVSYGTSTMLSAPSLFAGYEYTPEALEIRDDILLKDKHNESFKVLPRLFSEAGYRTTVFDLPFVDYIVNNYDYSLMSDIENCSLYWIAGAYSEMELGQYSEILEQNLRRSFFLHSLFKAVPVALQPFVYDHGVYYSTSVNHGIDGGFINQYSVLTHLENLTETTSDNQGSFVLLHNSTPHDPSMLQLPDYSFELFIDNRSFVDPSSYTLNGSTMHMDTRALQMETYYSTVATFIKLGEWFDYLRSQGVWDNTRIIIVSDHGFALHQFDEFMFDDGFDAEFLSAMLFYKDFNSEGFFVSSELMTPADTPTLALEGIVDDPINPYTGNPISSEEKDEKGVYVSGSLSWDPEEYMDETGFGFEEHPIYHVTGDIHNPDNWVPVSGTSGE